ncbi:pre-mycofactocin synthase MftD [Streptomyces sp. NBC_00696]|uniref:pre-mycofactocin synthase MftD n=1 Tax=Streptomyces sp. NBC_00696 TaxID=2903672 RepID=UPI002E302595|nr:pre-mycofactocin synthase MftD [Streptomyces sp. NBC_00696]
MGRNPWFETVAEAQRRARRRLPSTVYGALVAGSERGRTIDANTAAFAELGFAPRVVGHHAERVLSTTVLGVPLSFPVLISPTGVQAVDPEGEVAVARAAKSRGVVMGLSSFAGKPVEEVADAQPDFFYQLYWSGTRATMTQRMDRARAAGAKALIVTLDWSFSHGRDWGSPAIPDKLDLRTMLRFAPDVLPHPGWLLRFAKSRSLPDLSVPNLRPPGGEAPTFFGAYGEWMRTTPPTWEDVSWLRKEWGGPFLLKGVTRVDDAKRAVDAGVSALSVSNHGGNNLDTTPATVRVLPAIADAVGSQIEVLLDGGVRRGGDVAKALALGARAVLIGRAYLWGLAANGQAGVENILDILRGGLDSAVLGLGHSSVHELTPDDLVVPPGFPLVLGRDASAA